MDHFKFVAMETRPTILALCCISIVISSATALSMNDATESNVEGKGSEVIGDLLEIETKESAEKAPATPQPTVKNQSETEVDTAEDADEDLLSLTLKDTDGRSKFINNRYIPDDLSNINPKPLFDLLQQETHRQYSPKPLATTYDNFGPSTVFCDRDTKFQEENTYKLPKPTKLPSFFSRPITQSSKANTANKDRIKFKTISTSSQLISTPVGNLRLKLEISVAERSQPVDDEDTYDIANGF